MLYHSWRCNERCKSSARGSCRDRNFD